MRPKCMFLLDHRMACSKKNIDIGNITKCETCTDHQLYDPTRYENIVYNPEPKKVIDIAKIRELAAQGLCFTEMSQKLRCSVSRLRYLTTRENIQVVKVRSKGLDIGLLRELSKSCSLQEISETVKKHPTYVSRVLARNKIVPVKRYVRRKGEK